jgi:hypothetical protein
VKVRGRLDIQAGAEPFRGDVGQPRLGVLRGPVTAGPEVILKLRGELLGVWLAGEPL